MQVHIIQGPGQGQRVLYKNGRFSCFFTPSHRSIAEAIVGSDNVSVQTLPENDPFWKHPPLTLPAGAGFHAEVLKDSAETPVTAAPKKSHTEVLVNNLAFEMENIAHHLALIRQRIAELPVDTDTPGGLPTRLNNALSKVRDYTVNSNPESCIGFAINDWHESMTLAIRRSRVAREEIPNAPSHARNRA